MLNLDIKTILYNSPFFENNIYRKFLEVLLYMSKKENKKNNQNKNSENKNSNKQHEDNNCR